MGVQYGTVQYSILFLPLTDCSVAQRKRGRRKRGLFGRCSGEEIGEKRVVNIKQAVYQERVILNFRFLRFPR